MKRLVMWAVLALALACSGCSVTVTSNEPGTQSADGSVYLGFTLVTQKGGKDWFLVGQEYGYFSSVRINVADRPLELERVVLQFGNGQTWSPPLPPHFDANTWSDEVALPSPQIIEKITIFGRAGGKKTQFAKVSLYGRR
jgi:opacity protein-like surface antigen